MNYRLKVSLIGIISALSFSSVAVGQFGLGDLKKLNSKRTEKQRESNSRLQFDFKQDMLSHRDSLKILDKLKEGKGVFYKEKQKREMKALDKFAELCRTKYKDYTYDDAPEYFENPKISCTLALEKGELLAEMGNVHLKSKEKRMHNYLKGRIANIKAGKIREFSIEPAIDFKKWKKQEIDEAIKNYKVSKKDAESKLKSLDQYEKTLVSTFQKSINTNRYAAYKSNKIKNMRQVKKEAQRIVNYRKDMKLKYVGAVVANPSIEKAYTGIPVRKKRNIAIVVQKSGEKFCRMYTRMFIADTPDAGRSYQAYSGGNYGLNSDSADYFFLTKCK